MVVLSLISFVPNLQMTGVNILAVIKEGFAFLNALKAKKESEKAKRKIKLMADARRLLQIKKIALSAGWLPSHELELMQLGERYGVPAPERLCNLYVLNDTQTVENARWANLILQDITQKLKMYRTDR